MKVLQCISHPFLKVSSMVEVASHYEELMSRDTLGFTFQMFNIWTFRFGISVSGLFEVAIFLF